MPDKKILAEWWCELNEFLLPKVLKSLKPDVVHVRIMEWIEKRIGKKECLKEWNKEEGMITTPKDRINRLRE